MKVGMVLSGGGVRGVAHIGAIKALEESSISVTHIAGSSAGAVVAPSTAAFDAVTSSGIVSLNIRPTPSSTTR